ncbi:MAG: hypothetical protein ACR2HJ_13050 [Fimbriimonadales bacterium]
MNNRKGLKLILGLGLVAGLSLVAYAVHDTGNNILTFAPVVGSESPNARGSGETQITGGRIDTALNNGVDDGTDVWRASFQFSGLRSRRMYTITVPGRFDAPPPAESGIVTFVTDSSGNSRIWFQFAGLARLGVARLRLGGDQGPVVLQATRAPGGPGTIVTQAGGGWGGWGG